MNERVAALRRHSLESRPYLSTERAELITRFYSRSNESLSAPMRRALAFKHLMEHQSIYIGPGELIVGEKGPEPKAAPTFPELCCHSLRDLDVLNSREKTPYSVSLRSRKIYEEVIIPFWKGKSIRDLIFEQVPEEWRASYEAGVFTEFMEQRAPGHTVLDDKIYGRGLSDFSNHIK